MIKYDRSLSLWTFRRTSTDRSWWLSWSVSGEYVSRHISSYVSSSRAPMTDSTRDGTVAYVSEPSGHFKWVDFQLQVIRSCWDIVIYLLTVFCVMWNEKGVIVVISWWNVRLASDMFVFEDFFCSLYWFRDTSLTICQCIMVINS